MIIIFVTAARQKHILPSTQQTICDLQLHKHIHTKSAWERQTQTHTAILIKCYSFKKVCHFIRMFLLLHYHHIVSITRNDVYHKEKARNGKVCCHAEALALPPSRLSVSFRYLLALCVHFKYIPWAIIIKGILGFPAKLMQTNWWWLWIVFSSAISPKCPDRIKKKPNINDLRHFPCISILQNICIFFCIESTVRRKQHETVCGSFGGEMRKQLSSWRFRSPRDYWAAYQFRLD